MDHSRAQAVPVVETRDLEKVYRMGDVEVRAVGGVSISIYAGEFLAVMGASGSGKSTFMNLIGCLDRPTRGTYLLNGRDVGKLSSVWEIASITLPHSSPVASSSGWRSPARW